MQLDTTKRLVSKALCLGLLGAFLSTAGCSSSTASGSKTEDPAIKSMRESMESYKTKGQQHKQVHSASQKRH